MAQPTEQIEKQTIVARMSVSFYKMGDQQLFNILQLLENNEIPHTLAEQDGGASDLNTKDPNVRRQMIIARLFVLINQLDKDTLLDRLRSFEHQDFRWIRKYPRLECYLVVDFAAGGKAFRSCIRDISAGGVFIETTDKFNEDQDIALCFTLGESSEMLPFKVKGKVKRLYPDGIGVQYVNMSGYQKDIINALINKGR